MKDNSWEDELLDEVLGETGTPSFRSGSLDQMLAAVQQRRRARRRRIQVLTTLCLVASIGLFLRLVKQHHVGTPSARGPLLVHSEPLPSGTIVVTEPMIINTVSSSGSSVAFVEDLPPGELFEAIGDDRLLALLAGRPAALVHPAYGAADLVFLNPADANGFQIP